MNIGEKIKQLRKSHHLTQQEFADKLFISYQSISNWERQKGHPSAEMMLTIIDTFDLPLDYFLNHRNGHHSSTDEAVILSAFFKSMANSLDEKPTFESISKLSHISVSKLKTYFPSIEDLMYASINEVDKSIKAQVMSSLSNSNNILDVFINDMSPLLYNKRDMLHILYTRIYVKGLWIQFIKTKYKSIIISSSEIASSDPLKTEYLIETLMGFISVWMSQKEPESLEQFRNRIDHFAKTPLINWYDK